MTCLVIVVVLLACTPVQDLLHCPPCVTNSIRLYRTLRAQSLDSESTLDEHGLDTESCTCYALHKSAAQTLMRLWAKSPVCGCSIVALPHTENTTTRGSTT